MASVAVFAQSVPTEEVENASQDLVFSDDDDIIVEFIGGFRGGMGVGGAGFRPSIPSSSGGSAPRPSFSPLPAGSIKPTIQGAKPGSSQPSGPLPKLPSWLGGRPISPTNPSGRPTGIPTSKSPRNQVTNPKPVMNQDPNKKNNKKDPSQTGKNKKKSKDNGGDSGGGGNGGGNDPGQGNSYDPSFNTNTDQPSSGSPFPYFSQPDSRWSNKRLGKTKNSIGSSGSVVTSLSMLIGGFNLNVGGERPNPSSLNKYLTQAQGYDKKGEINWDILKNIGFETVGPFKSNDDVIQSMSSGNFCILNVGKHSVFATGVSGKNYDVMDPLNQSKKTYPPKQVKSARCFVRKQ